MWFLITVMNEKKEKQFSHTYLFHWISQYEYRLHLLSYTSFSRKNFFEQDGNLSLLMKFINYDAQKFMIASNKNEICGSVIFSTRSQHDRTFIKSDNERQFIDSISRLTKSLKTYSKFEGNLFEMFQLFKLDIMKLKHIKIEMYGRNSSFFFHFVLFQCFCYLIYKIKNKFNEIHKFILFFIFLVFFIRFI